MALAIRLTGRRRNLARGDIDPETAIAKRPHPARPTRALRRRLAVTWALRDGFEVYTLAPRQAARTGRVIYFHGGAYTSPITRIHWRFLGRMVEATGLTVTVPLYPLTPEHSCADSLGFAMALYRAGLDTEGGPPVALMGDSAGGGLALSLAMQVRDAELPPPGGLVLISPWLDVGTDDPAQERIEPSDVMLMRPGVRALGRWYAGDRAVTDARVSPLYGALQGLPPIELLCGSHDILVSDARRLVARARSEDSARLSRGARPDARLPAARPAGIAPGGGADRAVPAGGRWSGLSVLPTGLPRTGPLRAANAQRGEFCESP